jgi:hypothetical protein
MCVIACDNAFLLSRTRIWPTRIFMLKDETIFDGEVSNLIPVPSSIRPG